MTPEINEKVWNSMMNALGGATIGIVKVDPCPLCKVGILSGYANREGFVVAKCDQVDCWGNDTEFGKSVKRL